MLTYWIQQVLGVWTYLLFVLPFVGKVEGRPPRARRLYVCNHVSLLDTMLLGGVLFGRRRTPILVLGDRNTWHKTLLRRLLSSHVGFLIERGRISRASIDSLREYGRKIDRFELIVFPEGTRGDGTSVGRCQPGIYHIAEAAGVPVVPVAMRNVQAVSSKRGGFHPIRGLRKVTVRFGAELEIGDLDRDEFAEEVRKHIEALLR